LTFNIWTLKDFEHFRQGAFTGMLIVLTTGQLVPRWQRGELAHGTTIATGAFRLPTSREITGSAIAAALRFTSR
jgi:hypothetical protein